MQRVFDLVGQVSPSRSTVLIHGDSGTGKELIAKAIHANSPRVGRPFVPINTGSIPVDLLESTLFGHVRGAFTGAEQTRRGHFDVADGGTIFLDEIGTLGARNPSQAAAGHSRARVCPCRLDRNRQGRRAHCRGDQRQSGRARPRRYFSRGPLLPLKRHSDQPAPAQRARRGHPPARRALFRQVLPRE